MTGMGPTLHIINTYIFMYPNGFMILYMIIRKALATQVLNKLTWSFFYDVRSPDPKQNLEFQQWLCISSVQIHI